MIRFSELPIERLLDPKGYACNCGLHHVCDLRHFKCGAGVIAQVPQVVRDMGYTYPLSSATEHLRSGGAGGRCWKRQASIQTVHRAQKGERWSPTSGAWAP